MQKYRLTLTTTQQQEYCVTVATDDIELSITLFLLNIARKKKLSPIDSSAFVDKYAKAVRVEPLPKNTLRPFTKEELNAFE